MDSGFYYLLIVLCLVMVSVSMLRRSHQRRATSKDLSREQLARMREQRQLKGSMEELLIQLEEVSRRVNAQVDTRFMKLETVIRDADQRIARLEALLEKADAGARPAKAARSRPATAPPSAKPADADGFQPGLGVPTPASPPPEPPRAEPDKPQEPPPRTDPPPPASPASTLESGGPGLSRSQRRERVYELADAGTKPITIADMLRMPLGEVELLLNLRNFK